MAKKRLILGLALCFLVLLGALAGRLWYVSFYGLDKLSRYIFFCLGLTFFLFVLVALLGVAGVVLVILCHRPIPVFDAPINILITKLLPLSMYAGRLFRVAKQKLERSFIEINNTLVRARKIKVPPERLLILAPHCLQYSGCGLKVTADVNNCRSCGQCQIKDLLLLARELNVQLAVVTGGTLARKKVLELKPQAIVAVACERDLSSGLQDVYPLPAFGILNERPHGPCVDTKVSLERLRAAVLSFIEPEAETAGVN
ncbi:MAG: DUF116 domain-containing protein [Firmicutes bacterium]|nr:DUF116 domain-containing protein [Bacillota bacterium]